MIRTISFLGLFASIGLILIGLFMMFQPPVQASDFVKINCYTESFVYSWEDAFNVKDNFLTISFDTPAQHITVYQFPCIITESK